MIRKGKIKKNLKEAQTAVEYLILLGVVAAIVLIGYTIYVPRATVLSDFYFNKALCGIYGSEPEARTTMENYP